MERVASSNGKFGSMTSGRISLRLCRSNQSPAEGAVREIKKWYRLLFKKRVPDYGMCWVCEIQQHFLLRNHRIYGGVPLQKVTGQTPNISKYLEFGL